MTKKSNVGLILGIIGGVLLIPGIFCTACIGAAADIGSGGSGDGGAIVGYLIGIIGVVLSFVGAGLSKKQRLNRWISPYRGRCICLYWINYVPIHIHFPLGSINSFNYWSGLRI